MSTDSLPFRQSTADYPAHMLAERNLHLLEAVESTLKVLHSDIEIFNIVERDYQAMLHELKGVSGKIDADGSLNASLDQASDLCAAIWDNSHDRYQAALDDARLLKGTGVISAYERYFDALRSLHDTIEDLRHWVGDHDAILEPSTGQVFTDAESMFKSLLQAHS